MDLNLHEDARRFPIHRTKLAQPAAACTDFGSPISPFFALNRRTFYQPKKIHFFSSHNPFFDIMGTSRDFLSFLFFSIALVCFLPIPFNSLAGNFGCIYHRLGRNIRRRFQQDILFFFPSAIRNGKVTSETVSRHFENIPSFILPHRA